MIVKIAESDQMFFCKPDHLFQFIHFVIHVMYMYLVNTSEKDTKPSWGSAPGVFKTAAMWWFTMNSMAKCKIWFKNTVNDKLSFCFVMHLFSVNEQYCLYDVIVDILYRNKQHFDNFTLSVESLCLSRFPNETLKAGERIWVQGQSLRDWRGWRKKVAAPKAHLLDVIVKKKLFIYVYIYIFFELTISNPPFLTRCVFLSFSSVSLCLSPLCCQPNSCFSFGWAPNGWLRRVNGFLISLVNGAFSLVPLPEFALPKLTNRKKTWSGRRRNKQQFVNNTRARSEHQTFKLRGYWLGKSSAIWRISVSFLPIFVS